MSYSSHHHRDLSSLEISVMYPYCPDDEVREFIYDLRRENFRLQQRHDVSITRVYRPGGRIFVARKSVQSWPDIEYLVDAVNKMFMCSWPDVFGTKELRSLELPASMQEYQGTILSMRRDTASNKAVYNLYPLKMDQGSNSNDTLHHFSRALCTTVDVVRCLQPPWAALYNSFMASIWHDDLQDTGVSISFRPRWNLFPGDLGEWPVIVPDVVFSAVVPITDSRLLEARKLHPGYAFSAPSITDKTLEIPTLIVEYDKIDLLLDDQAPRSQAHRKHLEAAITAALPMHAALGLKTPVFGLFFGRYTADCFAGVLEEVNGVTMPAIYNISVNPGTVLNFDHRTLDVLHLRNIIANLSQSSISILDELGNHNSSELRYIKLPSQEGFRCARNRWAIDTQHPPLVEDETLQYIFSRSVGDVQRWASEANIIGAKDRQTTVEPSEEIRVWMGLFTEPEPLSQACIQDVVTDSMKGLSDRTQGLVTEFLSGYQHSSTTMDTTLPAPQKASLSFDIRASLTICSHAIDLDKMSANEFHPHSISSHWAAIYDSLFMRATQQDTVPLTNFQSYPQWKLHGNLQSSANDLQEIRPSCALLYKVGWDHIITQNFPSDCTMRDVEYLGPELTVTRLARRLSEVYTVAIPLMVGEYVLVPGDSDERAKHLAHLAMTMRSALALWEVHCLRGPIVGFLMERNIVETKLGWIDDDGKCVIRDASEYRFNLLDPYHTFRLYNLLRVFCSETFGIGLTEKMDTHATTAMQRLLDPSYQMWRISVR